MIDEQYIAKTIGILVLCRMLLSLKKETDQNALNQFTADFDNSVSFLFHVSDVLPYVRELDHVAKLYTANGKLSMLDGENEAGALLRWLKNHLKPNRRRQTYH